MLSPLDDLPVHQVAEVVRHPATSDRNFYDRYYFNCHPGGDEWFLLAGMGQYPNLGVADAFALLRRGDDHVVARASRALGADRADTTVGPFRVEVIEGLRTLRVVLEPGAYDLAFDLTFTGAVPATMEPRQFRRHLERVTMDTQRFAQTGHWSGHLVVDGERYEATPAWAGNRDRSWGVRPVGEPEPKGRAADSPPQNFFWIYSVMQFDDFAILTIVQEDTSGARLMEEGLRVWADPARGHEWLGRPEHALRFASGTRDVTGATLTYHRPGRPTVTVECEPLVTNYLGIGTGYGLDADWRHGMWQGELAVQGLRRKVSELDPMLRMLSPVDVLSRFRLDDGGASTVGMGLFEVAVVGPHEGYGFTSFTDTAP